MKHDIYINDHITIPDEELEFKASKASGPGGQHVNKTSSRISIRWNVAESAVLSHEEKMRLLTRLRSKLTNDGELILHESSSRSQQHNKKMVCQDLRKLVVKALEPPKKRMKRRKSKAYEESRLDRKKKRSVVKKLRRDPWNE